MAFLEAPAGVNINCCEGGMGASAGSAKLISLSAVVCGRGSDAPERFSAAARCRYSSICAPNTSGAQPTDSSLLLRRIDSLPLPARGEVRLAPGGLHLMLIDLRKPLVEKQRVAFTLVFADGSEVKAEMPVVSVLDEAPSDHAHHHH